MSAEILHKSDAGGVKVNLATPASVRDAIAAMASAPGIKGRKVDGYLVEEMAPADVIFSATGITDGSLLQGVHFRGHFAETETVVMRSKTGTVRRIKTTFRMLGTKGPV